MYTTFITVTLFFVAIMEWFNARRIGRFMETYEEMKRKLSEKEKTAIDSEGKEKDKERDGREAIVGGNGGVK